MSEPWTAERQQNLRKSIELNAAAFKSGHLHVATGWAVDMLGCIEEQDLMLRTLAEACIEEGLCATLIFNLGMIAHLARMEGVGVREET